MGRRPQLVVGMRRAAEDDITTALVGDGVQGCTFSEAW